VTVNFLYQLDPGDEIKEFPFPDEPGTHPPTGALFFDQKGQRWRCIGPSEAVDEATEQPKIEAP
jgi:hypothetical protein